MKRLLTVFLAAVLLSGMVMVGKAQAINLNLNYWHKAVTSQGVSYLSDHEQPYLWGVAQVGEIRPHLFSGPNQNIVAGPWDDPLYSTNGDGYLALRFGNLLGTQSADNVSYFGASNMGTSYLELWWSDTNAYIPAMMSGPNPGGLGAYDTFAQDMPTGSTLLLSAIFQPGALWVEETATTGNPIADQTDLFRANLNPADARAETLGYLDVVGGLWAELLQVGLHLSNYDALLADIGRDRGFDLRLEASNISMNPLYGWNFSIESGSATYYVIPEPGTILLLGLGLLGLAGVARIRRREG
ncbi:PEP-CTERM protein-sorting domain-containing protein [Desulfonatronum thiosulfatophilum]|uniref:PEP-CTERM protein-sorting domain-containing protein n=1 Tax=Desulfonatronum thiosulfatophilum TaxID=617002 RepID=A0A1G6ELJ7_9BACT|nr:PEP-CTERM sorting domain-containing protein [Desulfonatronum thiosulfatophilum]SDB58373.1 PEP-CTERM protein-sorting domain-containing protein [Desulfonatronum thiosulfatophilum]